MVMEKQLIKKRYYKNLLTDEENNHPINLLGHLYKEELSSEKPDFCNIRFSQGELYFHHKDFEAAIFKWEKVHNDLKRWARKNIGDAYYELGEIAKAIDFYNSVESNDLTLASEVSLKLFSIYNEQEELELAARQIKKAVSINPDYMDVTQLALHFFENYHDWGSAIELVVNEAIRTKRLEWLETLLKYVENDITKLTSPYYFTEALEVIYYTNQTFFEKLAVAFWNSYERNEHYFSWLHEINCLLFSLNLDRSQSWTQISNKYIETYSQFICGRFVVGDFQEIVPNILSSWIKIVDDADKLFAATSVVAWESVFNGTISTDTLESAKCLIDNAKKSPTSIDSIFEMFEEIILWAKTHDLEVDKRLKKLGKKVIDTEKNYILLVATNDQDTKTTIINSLLGYKFSQVTNHSMVMYSHDQQVLLNEITDQTIHALQSFSDIETKNEQTSLIEAKLPSQFLYEHNIDLLDISHHAYLINNDLERFVQLADSILYVITDPNLFTSKERDYLLYQYPNLPIYFLLRIDDTTKCVEKIEEIEKEISLSFTDANIIKFRLNQDYSELINALSSIFSHRQNDQVKRRSEKLLYYIRETLRYLAKRPIDAEIELTEQIICKEKLVTELNDAVRALYELEKETINKIQSDYFMVKDGIKRDLKLEVPKLLRECATFVTEDSDFQNIHIKLNIEMNKTIRNYLKQKILPKFIKEIRKWIETAKEQFDFSQKQLAHMCLIINEMSNDHTLNLSGDFKVIDDWRRDIRRLTNGISIETLNITNRNTASQLVLKSAGKFLGTLTANKSMLCNMYKKQIDKEDYENFASEVTKQFIYQFEWFEKGIERDIRMFFSEPITVIHQFIDEVEEDMKDKNEQIQSLKENPESYTDPLKIFQVRLCQYELLLMGSDPFCVKALNH